MQCIASVFCPYTMHSATTYNVMQMYSVIQCYPFQCIASVFCPVESSQAWQMHLIGSHDKNPDLFADNDGSADENADDAV